MRARQISPVFLGGALALVAVAFASAPAAAQCRVDPKKQTLLVPVLRSDAAPGIADSVSLLFADSLRQFVARSLCKDFFPVDKRDMDGVLQGSGYPTNTPLAPSDIKELAKWTNTDVVITGHFAHTRNSYTFTPVVMSPRNFRIAQQLAPVTVNRPTFTLLARTVFQDARAAIDIMPMVKACEGQLNDAFTARNLRNSSKEAESLQAAVETARKALVAYPKSVMARLCLAGAYSEIAATPPDSVARIAGEVLEMNPNDYYGLRYSEVAARKMGDTAKADDLLYRVLEMDPTNTALAEEFIRALAISRKFEAATRQIAASKAANPGQPTIIALECTVMIATEAWQAGVGACEELIKVAGSDTTMVNPVLYERIAFLNKKLGKAPEASQAIARGLQKFPESYQLHQLHSQYLREQGDVAGSVRAAQKALEIAPDNFQTYLQIALGFIDLKQPDSVVATIRKGMPVAKTGADSANGVNLIISEANKMIEAGRADTANFEAGIEKLKLAMRYAEGAAEFSGTNPLPYFTLGLASYTAGTMYGPKLQNEATRTCALLAEARSYFVAAQSALNDKGGGRQNRDATVKMLQGSESMMSGISGAMAAGGCKLD